MAEISREEHKKLLHNKLRTYIDEKQYQYEAPYITRADVEVILSDMEKLEKIEHELYLINNAEFEIPNNAYTFLDRVEQIIKG